MNKPHQNTPPFGGRAALRGATIVLFLALRPVMLSGSQWSYAEPNFVCHIGPQAAEYVTLECNLLNNLASDIFIYGGPPNLEGPQRAILASQVEGDSANIEKHIYMSQGVGGDRSGNFLQYLPGRRANLDAGILHERDVSLRSGALRELVRLPRGEEMNLAFTWKFDIPMETFGKASWKVRVMLLFLIESNVEHTFAEGNMGPQCRNHIRKSLSSSQTYSHLELNAERREPQERTGNFACRASISEDFFFLYSEQLTFHWESRPAKCTAYLY